MSRTASPTDPSAPSPRRMLLVVPLLLLAVTALAACGDDSSSSSGTTTTSTTTAGTASSTTAATAGAGAGAAADQRPTVSLATTDLGKVLVDADGRTLYAFTPDSATKSACTGSCAQAWPPAVAPQVPTPGSGVTGTLTVLTRDDGTRQVVVAGHPLYQYAGDAAAGDTGGQGSGGKWYVVGADGSLRRSAGSTTTTVRSGY